MALSDLSGHARPSHSACTSTHVMRPSVAHGAGLGAVLFPPAPGVVRINFVWEVRPYWAAFGLSHTNCMGFSAIRFVWPNICIFPKVDRGWQNYFDTYTLEYYSSTWVQFDSGWSVVVPKMGIFVFPPPRAPVTPPPPRDRPIRSLTGPKRAIFRPFFVAGGAKTRSAPKLRSAAGGDVLLTPPPPCDPS